MAEFDPKDYELYGYMSMQAYQDNGGVPPAGWQVLGDSASMGIGKDTGYYGVAYQNIEHPDQIVVAHRGTEFDKDTIKDGLADVQIGLHEVPAQFQDSAKFVEAIGKEADVSVGSITQTGHSLGGALAEMGGIVTDAPAYAVDPPGIKGLLPDLESSRGVEPGTFQNKDLDNLTVYSVQGDLVSGSIGEHPVPVTPIENPHFPGQVEAREQMHDIASKLVENMPHDDLRPAQDLPDILSGTKGLMDGVDNHSSAFAHALGQDMTAQDRMGPIYGPPTTEQPADHIPSKAEWAVGDGFHSLESQLNPPPADATQPNAQAPLPDAFAAAAGTPTEASAPATPDAAQPATQAPLPDASAAAAPSDTASQAPALSDAFAAATATPDATSQTPVHDAFAQSLANPDVPAQTPVHDAFSQGLATPDTVAAPATPATPDASAPTIPDATSQSPAAPDASLQTATPDAFAATQTAPAVDAAQPATQAPLPDAFAAAAPTDTTSQTPALPDAFAGAQSTPAVDAAQPATQTPLPDAFAAATPTDTASQTPALPDAFAATQTTPIVDAAQPVTQAPLPDAFAAAAPTDTASQTPAMPDAFAATTARPDFTTQTPVTDAFAPPPATQPLPDAFAGVQNIDAHPQTVLDTVIQATPIPDTSTTPLPEAFAAATPSEPISQSPLPDAFSSLQQNAPASADPVEQSHIPNAFTQDTTPVTPDAFATSVVQNPPPDAFAPHDQSIVLPDAFAAAASAEHSTPSVPVNDIFAGASDVTPPPAHDTYVPPADTYVPPAQEPSWQAPAAAEPTHEQPSSWVGSLFGGGGSQDHDSGRSSWVDHVTPDTTSHETHASPDTSHQTSWSDHVSHDTGSSVSHDSGSSQSHDSGSQSHDSGSHDSGSHDSGHGGHDSSGAGMGM